MGGATAVPDSLGKRIETANGDYFEPAPANIWRPSPLSTNGVLVVVGQVLHKADGSVSLSTEKFFLSTRCSMDQVRGQRSMRRWKSQTPMTTSAQTIPRPCCQTRMERDCWNCFGSLRTEQMRNLFFDESMEVIAAGSQRTDECQRSTRINSRQSNERTRITAVGIS
jgi:hypothetical protein